MSVVETRAMPVDVYRYIYVYIYIYLHVCVYLLK